MSGVICKYLVAPDEVYEVRGSGPDVRVANPERDLCAWAQYAPAAVEKLADTPPWLQHNALGGHLWRKGNCDTCPCFERGAPVEEPRP